MKQNHDDSNPSFVLDVPESIRAESNALFTVRLYFAPEEDISSKRKLHLQLDGVTIFDSTITAIPLHPHVYSFPPVQISNGTHTFSVTDRSTDEVKTISFDLPDVKQVTIDLEPLRLETNEITMIPL